MCLQKLERLAYNTYSVSECMDVGHLWTRKTTNIKADGTPGLPRLRCHGNISLAALLPLSASETASLHSVPRV